jgi:hypothetical protein
MTRRVNFESQQRVDQPDVQVMGELSAQDVRRHMRRLFMGKSDVASAVGRVIDGFEVTAENPGVSPRIVVQLDEGGGSLGSFVGAIDQGGGNIDWGQLGGDQDGTGNLEGSAQNLLDFTGQPVATYEIKARLSFAPGILDNRAFWNPATDAEFVKPTDTRLLPQWEIAYSGHSSAEWVLLAEVAWGGASIAAADITDKRVRPVDGEPRPTAVTAERWAHATQNDGDTYGVGDFDRAEDRGAAETNAVWSALRALARQVQDLKGGRESDLRYDWFSRPFAPPGVLAADPTTRQTKSLRSVDIITFTCADGSTEQGDFNGLSAVNDCFEFIRDNEASLPRRIHIVVKSRTEDSPVFTWTTPITITDKMITLTGLGGAEDDAGPNNPLPQGNVEIRTSGTPAGTYLRMTASSVLRLENIRFTDGVTEPLASQIDCDITSRFECYNSAVLGSGVNDGQGVVLRAPAESLVMENSLIVGTAYLGGRQDPGFVNGEWTDFDYGHGEARIKNVFFAGLLRLRHDDLGGASFAERHWLGNNMVFEQCLFLSLTAGTYSADGQVHGLGARRITFKHCDFFYHGSQDCVLFVTAEPAPAQHVGCDNLTIEDCLFHLTESAVHDGQATGAGGASGAEGTGWAVKVVGGRDAVATPLILADQVPKMTRIIRNRFESGKELDTATNTRLETPADAGFIMAQDCSQCVIDKNVFRLWTEPKASQTLDSQRLVYATATGGGAPVGGGRGYWITDNYFGDWIVNHTGTWGNNLRLLCLDTLLLRDATIGRNIFTTETIFTQDNPPGPGISPHDKPAALRIQSCLNTKVDQNHFIGWRDFTDPTLDTCVEISGVTSVCRFDGNMFLNCGGANIVVSAGAIASFIALNHNYFGVGADETLFTACYDDSAATTVQSTFVGNHWDHTGVTAKALDLNSSHTIGMISANMFYAGTVTVAGAGGAPYFFLRGYAEAGQDLNLVAGYL